MVILLFSLAHRNGALLRDNDPIVAEMRRVRHPRGSRLAPAAASASPPKILTPRYGHCLAATLRSRSLNRSAAVPP
jgi:hypothetical protein